MLRLYSPLLQQQLKAKEGEIVEIFSDFAEYHKEKPEFSSKLEELEYLSAKIHYKKSDGKVIGKHQGAQFYTIGHIPIVTGKQIGRAHV